MAINFPSGPATGQLYTFGQNTWQWTGEYWSVYSAQTGYITSVTSSGNGFPVIGSVSSNNLTLKSFSGDSNVIITDNAGQLNFSIDIVPPYNAGAVSGATWTNAGGGAITLPTIKAALYDNANFIKPIYLYTINGGTTGIDFPALTNNDTNYIVIDYNNGSPIFNVLTDNSTINSSDIVLYMIVYRADNFVHVLEFGNEGAGLPNKLNDRVIAVERFARESGLLIGLSGNTGVVTISTGVAWNGVNRQTLMALNSYDDVFFKNYHSGGNWVYTTTGKTLNNTYYDNGTNIVTATTGYYLTNWYYRGQEVNDHLYEVFSTNQYTTIAEAQLATIPAVPELISSHAFLFGRIIVGVGKLTGLTESAFVDSFQQTQVTLHNDLNGIQGGSAGEYYHINASQYNSLAFNNVDNNFSTNQTINGSVSATTYYGDGSNLTGINDYYVTGGTYANGTLTLDRQNGVVTVTGLSTGYTLTSSEIITVLGYTPLSAYTDNYVTGGTYANGTLTLDRQNGSVTISGFTISSGGGTFTGNTSASCITDLYITNLHGCSPITVWDSIQQNSNTTNSLLSVAFGSGNTTNGNFSQAEGLNTVTWGRNSHAEGKATKTGMYGYLASSGITNGVIILDAIYGDLTSAGIFFGGERIVYQNTSLLNTIGVLSGTPAVYNAPSTYLYLTDTAITIANPYVIGVPYFYQPLSADTIVYGTGSHVEGEFSVAAGSHNSSKGYESYAIGDHSSAEGYGTLSLGYASHAEGNAAQSVGDYSHAEGTSTKSIGDSSHAEGTGNLAKGNYSHAEGQNTQSIGTASHSEGASTAAIGNYSHAEGSNTVAGALSFFSNDVGTTLITDVYIDTTYGDLTSIFTAGSFIILSDSESNNIYGTIKILLVGSTWDGTNTILNVGGGLILGPTPSAYVSLFGNYIGADGENIIIGSESHAEGRGSLALGYYSHSEGRDTVAIGDYSHVEGYLSQSLGNYSHSEGYLSQSLGLYSHAGGFESISVGETSFIHSKNSSVLGNRSAVLGGQNITGITADTVYVPYLNLNYTPSNNNSNTQILTRNSGTGNVEYRDYSSFAGGGLSADTYVTGFTYNNSNRLTISRNGGQPDLNVYLNTFSGLTVNGNVTVNGNLTATTISTTLKDSLFLLTTPSADITPTQILSRNSTTGLVSYVDYNTQFKNTYVTGFTYSNNNLTISQNQGQPNLTVNISNVTGLTVNGSLIVSGNPGTTPVTIVGSGSTILNVQGLSTGQLLTVTDNLVGSLFSVNDISGLPILEVYSNNNVLLGSSQAPALFTTTKLSLTAGTNTIYNIPTSAYTGAYYDYNVLGALGARSGNVMAIWSGNTINYSETTTTSIGSTSGVKVSMLVSNNNAVLSVSANTSGWTFKTIVRSI